MPPTLLDDVITEILRRLPSKDLLRFRSVSKPWRSLIDSPNFTKLHLNTHNLGGIVMLKDVSWVNLDSPTSDVSNLPSPIEGFRGVVSIIGCCDGLVLIQHSRTGPTLWNPSTRTYRRLHLPAPEPEPGFPSRPGADDMLGFGHDPVDDEYKLVRKDTFPCSETGDLNSVYTVHSLKAKTWEKVEKLGFSIYISKGCVFACNSFHWIAVPCGPDEAEPHPSSPWAIMALDFGAKKFREVPKPEQRNGDGKYPDMMVYELCGHLCLIRGYTKTRRFVAWRMNEYGVKESWTKFLSVGSAEMGVFYYYIVPMAFKRNCGNRIILETGKGLAVFDLRTKTVDWESMKIPGVGSGYNNVCPCFESLVKLDWLGEDLEEEKPEPSGEKSGVSKKHIFLAVGFKLKL